MKCHEHQHQQNKTYFTKKQQGGREYVVAKDSGNSKMY